MTAGELFHAIRDRWTVVYATAIVYLHGTFLYGPHFFGWKIWGAKLVLAALAGYAGTALFYVALDRYTRGKRGSDKSVVLLLAVFFPLLTATAVIAHMAYFDGTQTEFSAVERVAYFVSLGVLSLLMRAFLASVLRFDEIRKAEKVETRTP